MNDAERDILEELQRELAFEVAERESPTGLRESLYEGTITLIKSQAAEIERLKDIVNGKSPLPDKDHIIASRMEIQYQRHPINVHRAELTRLREVVEKPPWIDAAARKAANKITTYGNLLHDDDQHTAFAVIAHSCEVAAREAAQAAAATKGERDA